MPNNDYKTTSKIGNQYIAILTTNMATATKPMYAVPHHHGWEVSAYISLIAVTIFVDDMTLFT